MALKNPRSPKSRPVGGLDEPEGTKRSDLEALLDHARQNPMLYVAGVAFVLVCLVAGSLYGLYDATRLKQIQTAYAAALQEDDPALVAASLEGLLGSSGPWTPEISYMLGEYSLRAQSYAKAEEAFNTVVDNFPKTEFAPKALDGIGFIHENRGDYQKALEAYRSITANETWAGTLIAMRQQFNIGRVLEKMERFDAAKEAYEKQIEVFPGTLDDPSAIAQLAQAALERMRTEHPELFADDDLGAGDPLPAAEPAQPEVAPASIETPLAEEAQAVPLPTEEAPGELATPEEAAPAPEEPPAAEEVSLQESAVEEVEEASAP